MYAPITAAAVATIGAQEGVERSGIALQRGLLVVSSCCCLQVVVPVRSVQGNTVRTDVWLFPIVGRARWGVVARAARGGRGKTRCRQPAGPVGGSHQQHANQLVAPQSSRPPTRVVDGARGRPPMPPPTVHLSHTTYTPPTSHPTPVPQRSFLRAARVSARAQSCAHFRLPSPCARPGTADGGGGTRGGQRAHLGASRACAGDTRASWEPPPATRGRRSLGRAAGAAPHRAAPRAAAGRRPVRLRPATRRRAGWAAITVTAALPTDGRCRGACRGPPPANLPTPPHRPTAPFPDPATGRAAPPPPRAPQCW